MSAFRVRPFHWLKVSEPITLRKQKRHVNDVNAVMIRNWPLREQLYQVCVGKFICNCVGCGLCLSKVHTKHVLKRKSKGKKYTEIRILPRLHYL